jgi:hypothetical protein
MGNQCALFVWAAVLFHTRSCINHCLLQVIYFVSKGAQDQDSQTVNTVCVLQGC